MRASTPILLALALVVPLIASCGAADAPRFAVSPPPPAVEDSSPRLCARGPTLRGVDVSYYQGRVDWASAHRAGIDFAFARVSDGASFVDPEFAANWPSMRAAAVVRGAYQYFRPSEDPIAQADLLIREIQARGGLLPGDIPPALDVETTDGVADGAVRARMQTWLDRVESAFGRAPLIYTAPGFWSAIGAGKGFGRYPLWVANWECTCPAMPGSWASWSFWQDADHGEIAGIGESTDVDRYNGTMAELMAFTGAAPAPKAHAASRRHHRHRL
jgi:lysozyme